MGKANESRECAPDGVPTITGTMLKFQSDGGHGAQSAFAHPTALRCAVVSISP
jgi:hypothetical protein